MSVTFPPRLYDLDDPAMRLIRRPDLAGTFVVPDSVSYRITLPDMISQVNPSPSWQREFYSLVRTALGLAS